MNIRDLYRFDELVNIAENLVIEELGKQLIERGLIQKVSQEAVQDMAAYALNLVRPMYRANLLGRLYTSAYQETYNEDIQASVHSAIDRILGNPPFKAG